MSHTKSPNHYLSEMRCPATLDDVDLFSQGAQEHWYEAYDILHDQAPVLRIPGEGLGGESDGYILTRYEDVSRVVRDPVRYPPAMSLTINEMLAAGRKPEEMTQANAMFVSMMTLRPTIELWRTRQPEP